MPSKIHAAKCASHGSIAFVLQKLGIPTEISTTWLNYYDNPIDAMATATPCTSCQGSTRQDRTTVSLCVIARKLEASGIMQTVDSCS